MDLEASNIVKPVRVLLSLLMVAAVLFASTSSVSAIGFDAEKAYESVFVVYSGTSLGSGFAIGENCVITNAHVIADNDVHDIVKDEAWYRFYTMLQYKARLNGILVYTVPRAYPIWNTCSACGMQYSREPQTQAWLCPKCGTFCGKGGNAARNVQKLVEKQIQYCHELNRNNAIPEKEDTADNLHYQQDIRSQK